MKLFMTSAALTAIAVGASVGMSLGLAEFLLQTGAVSKSAMYLTYGGIMMIGLMGGGTLLAMAHQSINHSAFIQELQFLARISVKPERAAADLRDLEAGANAAWGDLTALTQNPALRNTRAALDLVDKANDAEVAVARYQAVIARFKIPLTT
jgi:hypothetical protein